MTRIFVNQQPMNGVFRLGRDYKKRLVKVMRLNLGDSLQVVTRSGKYECRLQQVLPDEIHLQIESEISAAINPSLHLILGQAIPKGNRFEWLIQKATELGVAEIYPLITERSVVKPSKASGKLQRWNEIAEHAAGQSENTNPVLVHEQISLPSFLDKPINSQLKLVLHERKKGISIRDALSNYKNHERILFIVGPEGGWSDAEIEAMIAAGYQLTHLGPRILRAETCGIVMAALLQYELGDLRF